MRRVSEPRRHSTPVILPSITLTSYDENGDAHTEREISSPEVDDDFDINNAEHEDKKKWEALRRRIVENNGGKSLNSFINQIRLKRQRQPRHMSVDYSAGVSPPSGILKNTPTQSNSMLAFLHNHHSEHRKSVSFCETDKIKVFSADSKRVNIGNNNDDEDDDQNKNDDIESNPIEGVFEMDKLPVPKENQRELVPTFVFPRRKPNFSSLARKKVLLLEDLTIKESGTYPNEETSIIGIIRVNITRLRALETKEQKKNGQRISVGASYSVDNWSSHMSAKAYKIPSVHIKPYPGLEDIQCVFMRFYIDCEEVEIGNTLSISLWCVDRCQITSPVKHEDTNDGVYYKIKCTPYLNPWAAQAAEELKNFAPTIRYNKNFYPKSKS